MADGTGDHDRGRTADQRLTQLLPDEVELELDRVEARRRQLFLVGGIAAIGAATIATLVLVVDTVDLPTWAAWALLVVTALFLVDAASQERALSSITRAAVAQRQRGMALEDTISDLTQLLQATRRINAVLLPEAVYGVVLEEAVQLLRGRSGSIRLRVGDLLAVAASTGEGAPTLGQTTALEDDPAVVVVTLGVEVAEEEPPRIALPITVGDRHVGLLEVERARDGEPFSTQRTLIARLFAEEAATAFVNANRYDAERTRVEQLATDREQRADAVADTVHDLRAPLAGLVAYAELLRNRFDDLGEARRHEAVEAVDEAAQQLRQLVDAVFDAASAEAQATRRREPVRIAPLAEEVAAAAAPGDAAAVRVRVEGDPVALGDPEALQRVLINLVANALEHGTPPVEVRARVWRGEVRVHVADRGPGIPPGQLDRVFDRRNRDDGSPRGRGLAIVDTLVRAMGGHVGVRSRPGVGTVFTVRVPVAPAEQSEAPGQPAAG